MRRSKPVPDMFEAALTQLAPLPSKRMIVVSDTPTMPRLRPKSPQHHWITVWRAAIGNHPSSRLPIFQSPADL